MGIDIYAKWRGQTKDEEEKQMTGFSVTSGDVGYLREAYHGGPYVTKYLVQEAFEAESSSANIPGKVLRQRLPGAVMLAMVRNKKVYQDDDPANKEMKDINEALKDVFENQMQDSSHEEIVAQFYDKTIETMNKLIAMKTLPDYAQSFVDFVELCEEQEKKGTCSQNSFLKRAEEYCVHFAQYENQWTNQLDSIFLL